MEEVARYEYVKQKGQLLGKNQWNEHPISSAFGRTWRIAPHMAFSKSKVTFVTLGSFGTMDRTTWRTAL